jgi:NtrC-family two-component system sensor histidine kinase KinB
MSKSSTSGYAGRVIMDDLLTLVRLERGRLQLNLQALSPARMLNDALDRHSVGFKAKGVSIQRARETHTLIEADETLLARVIDHLLDNALRYTPENGKVATICQVGASIELLVANSGPAIPVADQELIFQKFAQRPIHGARDGRSGLGLFLCRKIVKAHGGTLSVHEIPGYPACFSIALPSASSGTHPVIDDTRTK